MKSLFFFASIVLVATSSAVAEWREGTRLPTAVPHAVAAEMDSKLYVMSGKVGQGLAQFLSNMILK